MVPPCRTFRPDREEGGFTLVEMVIAIAVGAIVFTALAAYMSSGLKVLGVQKARTQGNEIATQGIEDLQRLDDDYLGLCAAASPTPPDFAGLDPVTLPHCTNAVVHDPCSPPAAPTGVLNLVPDEDYNCSRLGITYRVRRHVAWTTSTRVAKRLAVHVTWIDSGVSHEVFQASTRTTSPPPAVTAGSVNSLTSVALDIAGDGTPVVAVTLRAVTTGLSNPATSGDAVRGFFTYRDPSDIPRRVAVSLTSADGTNWEAPITTFKLPPGRQYVIFTAVRADDKEEGSGGVTTLDATCISSCPSSPTPPVLGAPVLTYLPAVGAGPNVDSAGVLVSDSITVSVTTNAAASPGSVTAILPTAGGGAKILPLALGATPCGANCWSATLTKAAAGAKGFRFSNTPAGAIRAMAAQGVAFGSTAISSDTNVTFQ